jgi:hypothetical protein
VLWHALLARPPLLVEALVFAAAAALLPHARARGPWAIAALGAAMLTAALLPVPDVAAIPLVACIWVTCTLSVAWSRVARACRPVVSDGRMGKAHAS